MNIFDQIEEAIGNLEKFKYELQLRAYDREAHKEMILAQTKSAELRYENSNLHSENKKLKAENERLVKRLLICEPSLSLKEFLEDMEITKQNNIKIIGEL